MKQLVLTTTLLLATNLLQAQTIKVDPALPSYSKTTTLSGSLSSVGSDTLNNLMTLWAEGFQKKNPNVRFQIEGKGSSTAPPALIEGVSQFGPMSRPMKSSEIDAFEKKFGYKPTAVGVALDALAVYVSKDNPIDSLNFEQVDAIFSKTRKLGAASDIKTWGQLGLTGAWANKPISVYGRNSASGTYSYFKSVALAKGDYKDIVKEQPGSAAVVNGITSDAAGIGYSGMGYKTSGVKMLSLDKGNGVYEANYDNVLSGKYPLGRMLFVYVNKKPGQPINPAIGDFFKFVLSAEGQEVVVKDGYLPLPAALAAKQLSGLE